MAPAARPWESGLALENGSTAPFVVDRGWVGPAGTYIEEWSIRRGDRVLYRHPASYIEVRGFQAVRRFTDTVRTPLALEPGEYEIVLVVEGYRMGSFTVEATPLGAMSEAAPAPAEPAPAAPAAPAPAPAPAEPAPASAAPRPAPAPAAARTGEDPAAVRKRVYEEELAKGSDPRVAEARAKSAEVRAKKAAAAPAAPARSAAAPAPARPPEPAPPSSPPPVPAPPGGGGFSPEEAAVVRRMIFEEATAKGQPEEVAEALAKAAENRARRGPWWRPDW